MGRPGAFAPGLPIGPATVAHAGSQGTRAEAGWTAPRIPRYAGHRRNEGWWSSISTAAITRTLAQNLPLICSPILPHALYRSGKSPPGRKWCGPPSGCGGTPWLTGASAKAIEVIFRDAKLLEDLMEQPAAYLSVAVDWNGSCASVGMAPACMATLLPSLLEAELSGNSLNVTGFSWHWRLSDGRPGEEAFPTAGTPPRSCRTRC